MRQKVIDAARERGLDLRMKTLQTPTRTAAEAAEAVGVMPDRIAKAIVIVADGEPVVCVISGAQRVDPERLCEVIDCVEARQATPDEVRAATGFSPGGVAPLGHGLTTLVDQALLEHDRIWAAGGDGCTLFEVDPRVLAERIGARVAAIGRPAG